MKTLSQRILDVIDDLTRSERRLAELLLQDPDTLVLLTASELSAKANVSKATTARFFRRLGYPSSKTAQKEARQAIDAPHRRPKLDDRRFVATNISQHLATEMQNLVRSVEQMRSDDLSAATTLLARGEKLWIVGFGDNYPLAHFARSLLIRVKPDIRMIPIGGFSVPEEFASIRDTDVVVALGVGRKSRGLRSIMRSARAAGAGVILITDQATPAANDAATITLRCRTQGASVFDSVVAPVSLLSFLCSSLALRIGQDAIDRLQFIDRIHEEWGEVLTEDL
ncbi:MurR/RpiR family transcriptional regulator [Jiella avicenniae]|uniref:MurR/RpiR family transcriptional regulator n=1 Tax=Jiella avicenniae TaxID=2907202 RepID=A0A9X1NZU0_9HYPH|nr:MurR/RpiR family transcriptional regulator [Jiella avicenniae]MCE7027725.1 MurR/RpiR family transcriptional regulator [Jiella avicenniae]MCE7028767.1 MurR/RpiR family transcriptional regulator [Jiella avicenniae]